MSPRMREYVVLNGFDPTTVEMTSNPLSVGWLSESAGVEFWAEFDPDSPTTMRTFQLIGTGGRVPEGATYVGTAPRSPDGGFVWHLYELHNVE